MVESLLETLTKRKSQTFYRPIDLHSVTKAVGEDISLISKWNIVNQLGKHDYFVARFSCAVYNLKGMKLFSNE